MEGPFDCRNPGYPVSAVIAYEIGQPILSSHSTGGARGSNEVPSRENSPNWGREFLRVKVGKVGERFFATPLPRGSGLITSLTRADGIIRIPSLSEGLDENREVEVELLKPAEEIENTVVMVGSHDLTIDILANLLGKSYPPLFLSSQNVGSLGGILAIKNGFCHMAGSHLLDPETGEYNFPYIRTYLKGIDVKVVHLVLREQGLMVQKGNPKKIRNIEDLLKQETSFINRQKGSGTRILFDHILKTQGLDPRRIQGYETEEFTHMAVASTVASGRVDAGLGILPAAVALGLDFIPVGTERYDLIIPAVYFEDEKVHRELKPSRLKELREDVLRMGAMMSQKDREKN
jgi:putative molybdopterin biosynthesis protein